MDLIRRMMGDPAKETVSTVYNDKFIGGRAVVPGFDHIDARRNCQDAASFGEFTLGESVFRFGISIDGCGSGKFSEVGAFLANRFVSWKIKQLLFAKINLREIPEEIFDSLMREMWRILPQNQTTEEIVQFILEYLCFTLFVFVQGPDETIVFYLGDGMVCVNGEIIVGIEKKNATNNAPDYLAYGLIPQIDRNYLKNHPKKKGGPICIPPKAFEILVFPTAEVNQLLIGSDAWHNEVELIAKISKFLLSKQVMSVQSQMNVWSGVPRNTPTSMPHFSDDASIAYIQRVAEPKEELSEASNP